MAKHFISLKNKENSFIFLRKLEHNIDNTNFTYQQRCYNNIFTNFQKLIDGNLFSDVYYIYIYIYLNLQKICARSFVSMAFFSKFRFTDKGNLIFCLRQLNFFKNTTKFSLL